MARLSNITEKAFADLAASRGWEVTKRGWPDFLCFGPDGKVIAVEVKPRTKDGRRLKQLKTEQRRVLDALSQLGVPCFVSDGESLIPYEPGSYTY